MTAGARSRPSERALLVTAALTAMLLPLNSTMIAVALPDIGRAFGGGVGTVGWLVSGYLVAMAALQPLAGKLGDRFGRRTMIAGGLAWFLVSLGAVFAPNLPVLIAFRVQQGVAGALAFPNALAVIREELPEQRRGAAFGALGAATALAAAAGPPLGGALVAIGGWHAIFLVNLPWAGAALLLALRTIPRRPPAARRERFDWIGGAGLLITLGAAAWLLNPGGVPVWVIATGAAACIAALAALLRYEAAHPDPVLRPQALRVRPFAAATAAMGLANLALYSTLLAVPVLLSGRPGWSSGQIGLVLAALTVPMVAFSPVGGRLSDRIGRRSAATAGLALLGAAMLLLAVAGGGIGVPLLVGSLLVAGAGLGLSTPPVQAAGIEALDVHDAGMASGILSTGRYLGGIVAATLVVALAGGGHPGGEAALFAIAAGSAWVSAVLAGALPGAGTTVPARTAGPNGRRPAGGPVRERARGIEPP